MSKPENSSAFPWVAETSSHRGDTGMDLLTYFAGQALTGIRGNPENDYGRVSSEYAARLCYDDAEAMLKEREKRMK